MRQLYYKRVSIVIPVYNREKTIEKCIQSLINLDYPKKRMEIIFVDTSTDNTSRIFSKYNKYNIRVLSQRKQGISAARNLGIKNSNGEIIAFIDSDSFVAKDWLKNLVGAFNNGEIGGVGGNMPNYNPETEIEKYLARLTDNQQCHLTDPMPYFGTGNVAYLRRTLEVVGLFDTGLIAGEDADLSWRVTRVGFKLIYEPSAIAYHKNTSTVKDLINRQFRDGKGWAQLQLKYRIPIKVYKNLLFESPRLLWFILKFLSRFILSAFTEADSLYVLSPLYDFIREISYLLGYISECIRAKLLNFNIKFL